MSNSYKRGIVGEFDIKKNIFNIVDGNVALNSSFSRRFWARFIDFSLSLIVGVIIFIIFNATITVANKENILIDSKLPWIPGVGSENPGDWSGVFENFDEFTHSYYSPLLMSSMVSTAVGTFLFQIGIPMINWKNRGQSLGKKFLKISIAFDKGKNLYISILIRELPISILSLFGTFLSIIVGADMLFIGLQYNAYYNSIMNELYLTPEELLPNILPYKNPWFFMTKVVNQNYMGISRAENYQIILGYMGEVISLMNLSFLIIITTWVAISNTNYGPHDRISKTRVIDMRTLQSNKSFKTYLS